MGLPWPAGVPQCPVPGNTRQRTDARIRTSVDVGPRIVRRRYTATTTNLSWTLPPLTGTQRGALESFYINDLQEGALRVDIQDVASGATVEARFLAPPRFVGIRPDPNAPDRLWRCSVELEIMP